MATITSTIKLVDQMTPTLNKISKAIDNVSKKSANVAKTEKATQSQIIADRKLTYQMIKRLEQAEIAETNAKHAARAKREREAARIATLEAKQAATEKARIAREAARAEKQAARDALAAKRQADREALASARKKAKFERQLAEQNAKYGNAMVKYTGLINYKQSQFSSTLNKTRSAANGIVSTFRRLLATLGLVLSLKSMAGIADTVMNANARINNITGDLSKTKYYMDAIYESAQRSRASFTDTANSVGKLATIAGSAFGGSMEQVIGFTELMNKLFVISGASAAESSNAMYQLTQAMAAGRLQGDEMRSILENAPLLAQKIADKMGVAVGEVKQLGAEGKVTANIIKEALFESADEIEEKFKNMPKTLGQTWTEISNFAVNKFRRVIDRVQQFINSPTFENFKNRIFRMITQISNAVIRLFDVFETPRMQNAISKICAALSVLWDIVLNVGTFMVNVATWICDNWSWIAPIVHTIAWAFIVYKVAMVIATVAMWAYNAAQFAAGLIAGTVVLTTFGWVVLIIVAIIAVIYLAVAAWNHFTDSSVSATGIILGSIMFVVACIWDLVVVIWDCLGTIVDVAVWLGKSLVQIVGDLIDVLVNVIIIFFQFICNIFIGIAMALCTAKDKMVGYWELLVASAKFKFYDLALMAVSAFNNMIESAGGGAKKMLEPFVDLYNKIVNVFNKIVDAWNESVGKLQVTAPEWMPVIGGKTFGVGTFEHANTITVDDIISFSADLESGLSDLRSQAIVDIALAKNKIAENDITDAFMAGFTTIEYWDILDGVDFGEYAKDWSELVSDLKQTWDSDSYWNPVDAYNDWYEKGAALENGVSGLVDGIGALLGGLFGGGSTTGSRGELNRENGSQYSPSQSLEDLISGANDPLGSIADNTGKGADSTSNIEDKLDLAEEELELLRKLAEQEVINRFTTAEIHVDMTNNNNISSKMDLDGIVTHLSNKLYEELGVVASGVHY